MPGVAAVLQPPATTTFSAAARYSFLFFRSIVLIKERKVARGSGLSLTVGNATIVATGSRDSLRISRHGYRCACTFLRGPEPRLSRGLRCILRSDFFLTRNIPFVRVQWIYTRNNRRWTKRCCGEATQTWRGMQRRPRVVARRKRKGQYYDEGFGERRAFVVQALERESSGTVGVTKELPFQGEEREKQRGRRITAHSLRSDPSLLCRAIGSIDSGTRTRGTSGEYTCHEV